MAAACNKRSLAAMLPESAICFSGGRLHVSTGFALALLACLDRQNVAKLGVLLGALLANVFFTNRRD